MSTGLIMGIVVLAVVLISFVAANVMIRRLGSDRPL